MAGHGDFLIAYVNPLGARTSMSYDAVGRQTAIEDSNNKRTTQTVDAAGRLTATKDGNAETVSFVYDAVDNRVTVPEGGGITCSYEYGNCYQLTREHRRVHPRG